MKHFILGLFLIPQLAFSQYRANCFRLDLSDIVFQVRIGKTICRDTILVFSNKTKIAGFTISGISVLNNDNDSYIRVTLMDEYNYEYLVYENYPMLSDNLTTEFSNNALETVSLNDIIPQCLKIKLLNASLKLDSINYLCTSAKMQQSPKELGAIQKSQVRYIVERLNTNLVKRNMTWRAGMTSMSETTYSEKKDIFGGKVPLLYGFEHYIGGIYIMPGRYTDYFPRSESSIEFISDWDWRNRHGKNWMTTAKNQNYPYFCESCWAFSAIGTFESYINLYYNQLLNYDLSEQEILSCGNAGTCQVGGYLDRALLHIVTSGTVPEACFRYTASNSSCDGRCPSPTDVLSFGQFQKIETTDEDSIKRLLFDSPICFGIGPWWHVVVLVGFKQIQSGEYYFTINSSNYAIPIPSDNPLVGHSAWLIKNSWGTNWGENGFGYVAMPLSDAIEIYKLSGNVTSMILNVNDIVCSDSDGDGYYFWGIGNKLSSWPSWIPDSIDGDDNDPQKGKLCLDSTQVIGELETINPNGISSLTINSNTTYTTRQYRRTHIVIPPNKTLTVKNILNLFGKPTITVNTGGQLIVDGGVITNANIDLASGAKLELKNGGKIVMRTNTDFVAPLGAIVDITHGEILRSNDF